MLRVMRLFAAVAVALIVFFTALISLIPSFAPETAVLTYTVPVPDRTQDIWLMDARNGASYFTGVTYRFGNYLQWSPDGNIISTINFFNTPTTLDVVYLNGGAPRSFPLQTSSPGGNISPDGTKFVYRSAASDGSLNVIDLLTGEETTLVADLPVTGGSWLPDGETLLLSTNPEGSFSPIGSDSLYTVALSTGVITPLFEDFTSDFSTMIYDPFQLIFAQGSELFIAQVGETPDEARLITTFDAPTIRSMVLHPAQDDQLVVTVSNQGVQETWLVNINNGERELLHEFETSQSLLPTIRWSPDGRMLVRVMAFTTQVSTFLISSDERPDFTFTLQGEYGWLRWSRDGRFLAVYTTLNSADTYYLLDTVDNSVKRLDVDVLPNLMWQPEGE